MKVKCWDEKSLNYKGIKTIISFSSVNNDEISASTCTNIHLIFFTNLKTTFSWCEKEIFSLLLRLVRLNATSKTGSYRLAQFSTTALDGMLDARKKRESKSRLTCFESWSLHYASFTSMSLTIMQSARKTNLAFSTIRHFLIDFGCLKVYLNRLSIDKL